MSNFYIKKTLKTKGAKEMAMNKINLTINSRMYTLISDESPEYMEMLGAHVNEKIRTVMEGGKNLMGERPMVLAALNICDEYYKLLEQKGEVSLAQLTDLRDANREFAEVNEELEKRIELMEAYIKELEEKNEAQQTAQAIAQTPQNNEELEQALTQVKFLEGRVKELEDKAAKMKKDYERREQEIFDMFDTPSNGGAKNRRK